MLCYYKLRLDLSRVSSSDCVSVITSCADVYAYVLEKEGTANPHLHAYVETIVNNATLRARIRKLGLSGNGGYSLAKVDPMPMEYLAYMMKEGTLVTSDGFPQEILDRAREYQESYRKKKKEKTTVLAELSEKVQEMSNPSCDQIIWLIVCYYKDRDVLIRDFHVKSLCTTLCLKYVKNYDVWYKDQLSAYITGVPRPHYTPDDLTS